MGDRILPVQLGQRRILPTRRQPATQIVQSRVMPTNSRALDFPQRPAPHADSAVLRVIGPGGTIAQLFPNYETREPQIRLALAIEEAIRLRQHFPAEAGTGVGKSFAYLAAALTSKRKTAVAVPTLALMEQLLTKDIPFLQMAGVIPGGFTYALLKGRANYVCRYKYDAFKAEPSFDSPNDAATWRTIRAWADDTRDGDTGKLTIALPLAIKSEITATSDECLGESCPAFASCYAEIAKGKAATADLIVTNMAMLLRDIGLRRDTDDMASIMPDGIEVLILDECHRLEGETLNALARETTIGRLAFIVKRIETLVRRAARADVETRQAAELVEAAESNRLPRQITESTMAAEWKARTGAVVKEFESVLSHYVLRLEALKDTKARLGDEFEIMQDAMQALYGLITDLALTPSSLNEADRKAWEKLPELTGGLLGDLIGASGVERKDNELVRFVSIEETKSGKRVTLTVTPIDAAPVLRDSLWNASFYKPFDSKGRPQPRLPLTVIAVSATIDAHDGLRFWRERVGLENNERQRPGLIVGSPFDYARNALTYVPNDGIAFDASLARKSPDPDAWTNYLDLMANEYRRLIMASGGRAFALFTANSVLDHVHKATRADFEAAGYQVLRQGDAPMAELVRLFKSRPSVLFGVQTFWEGVDIQGDDLSMVVISGLPFTPPSDPVFSAQCEQIDRRYGRMASFRMLSLPRAIISLRQGYGRGIRSGSDRAVMAILAGQIRSRGYGQQVLDALPPAPVTGDMTDVEQFFVTVR